LSAFKKTPGPVEVRVGDEVKYQLPTIINEAGLDYNLKVVKMP